MEDSRQSNPAIATAAASWLARRDRGLSAAEQDAYLQWLHESPEHGQEIARQEQAWQRLDSLRDWLPAHSSHPNPNLLAPPKRRRWLWTSLGMAAAAMVLSLLWWRAPADTVEAHHRAIVHPGPHGMTLADGSLVEMNAGAKVDVNFTPEQRTVHLVRGEAHFIVTKNRARPFVVEAGKFAVRAVGTAFDVRLQPRTVSVLVTEGNVQLRESRVEGEAAILSRLSAGQEATMTARAERPANPVVQVRNLNPEEMEMALAWQSLRLEFVEMPLSQVAEEFNRYNSRKLVVADAATGSILIGGTFRADNVEAFVRLLDVGFGVEAQPRGENLVLLRRR